MKQFNESNTIEKAIIAHLTNLKGVKQWQYLPSHELPRQTQEILIEPYLKQAICQLNPELKSNTEDAEDIIYKLKGILLESTHTGLVRANQMFNQWLNAEKSLPLGKNHEHITIKLIDFNHPENNHYLVSNQVKFIGTKTAYFDLVFYINGIPLIVGEVKTPVRASISWQDGATDFLGGEKHYWHNQKTFFVPNLFCFASEGKTFAYGAINATFQDWMPWYQTTDHDEDILPSLSTVLSSCERLLNPVTILNLLQNFALYSTTKATKINPARKIKILPRYPQYEATLQIVERVKQGVIKQGLIWHFQGSGKSLLMLYAAKMLKNEPSLQNPTVMIVIDRVDLDIQINSVFNNADLKNITKVNSCQQLAKELQFDNRNILITTIFKFGEIEINSNQQGLNNRGNIIVLVDEAHRTQEGTLGEKMRWALPHAFFFGLTGTPVSSLERNTFKLFGAKEDQGRYLNRYSYQQSIRDQATLPIKFEPRLVELRVDEETINQEFEQLTLAYNLSEGEKAQLSQKAGKLAHLLKAPQRLKKIADDITAHFRTYVEPKGLKGIVVVYDRSTCVLMYDLLTKNLGAGSCEVIMNVAQGTIEDEKNETGQQSKKSPDWEKWQDDGLPLTETDFKRWQSIDHNTTFQEQTLDRYRDREDPLKILIVTAKLLTGFDAPICYCMYLDKPLRDHTLLQAMCRTNRLYNSNKQYGLIVDYLGVFENVAVALSYNPQEIEGMIEALSLSKKLIPPQLEKCLAFFPDLDLSLGGYEGLIASQNCLNSNDLRDLFASEFNQLKKLWEAVAPDKMLHPYQQTYQWLVQIYESIRPIGGLGSLIWQSLGAQTIKLIHNNTEIERIRDDIAELIIDKNSLFSLTEAEQTERAKKLEISLMAKIRQKQGDPNYLKLGQRLEKLREKYEAGVLNSLNWLKELLDTATEVVRLDHQVTVKEKIIVDQKQALTQLFQELRTEQTPEVIAQIVEDIDLIVKATRFPGWQDTNSGDRQIKQVLRQTLLKYQLHKDQELFEKAYLYLREHY